MRHVAALAICCATLAAPAAAFAQDRPDLSGRWRLDVASSAYEQSSGPRAEIETIAQTAAQVRLRIVSTTRDIVERYELTVPTDGTAIATTGDIEVAPAIILRSVSAQWDGGALVLHERLDTDEGPFEAISRYSLAADRQTLSLQTGTADGHVIRTLVFDRCDTREPCE